MLTAKPYSGFSWDFNVYEDETPVAFIDNAWVRERASLAIGGTPCEVYRESALGAFVLEADGHRLVQAVKPSVLTRTFEITYDDRFYTLKARSAFGRTFVLQEGAQIIGTIAPHHAFSRKMRVDLPEAMPLVVRVFIIWLVILLWKRAASS